MKLFILALANSFGCCFFNCLLYFAMKDKPVIFFLWMMSFSMSCYNKLLIGFPSDILQTFSRQDM